MNVQYTYSDIFNAYQLVFRLDGMMSPSVLLSEADGIDVARQKVQATIDSYTKIITRNYELLDFVSLNCNILYPTEKRSTFLDKKRKSFVVECFDIKLSDSELIDIMRVTYFIKNDYQISIELELDCHNEKSRFDLLLEKLMPYIRVESGNLMAYKLFLAKLNSMSSLHELTESEENI